MYSSHRRLKYVTAPAASAFHTTCGTASVSVRNRSSLCRTASVARRRSRYWATLAAIGPRSASSDSDSLRRANKASTPSTRPSTSSGYPANATIPSRAAHSGSLTFGSFGTSLVRCGVRFAAMRPILNCPTGTRACGPSVWVYMPALARSSSHSSDASVVHTRANAAPI